MIIKKYTDRESLGMRIPWYLGFCWRNFDIRATTYAVMPLNWLMGWGRTVYYRLMRGPRDVLAERYEKVAAQEREWGLRSGYEDGNKAGIEAERVRMRVVFDEWQAERLARHEEIEREIEREGEGGDNHARGHNRCPLPHDATGGLAEPVRQTS